MKNLKQILFKREHAGFVIGAVAMLVAYELTEPWRALILCALVFGGLPLARKVCR